MKNILLCGLMVMLLATGCSSGSDNADNETAATLEVPYVVLNDGHRMPVLGLGTWTQDNDTAEESVYTAIKCGYRLIDTARYYGNEAGVGRGVRRAMDEGIITREDIFITSKIVPGSYADYDELIAQSNRTLGLGYIDLMLIHQPGYREKELYRALERAVKNGTVKSLGISNYYTPEEFRAITEGAKIMPVIVQNENHICYQNTDLQKYLEPFGVIIESWYPFGGRGHVREVLNDAVIGKIARDHGKSAAQVILRWHIQAGYVVIPGSSSPEHIAENIDVFGFELTDEEMNIIAGLNQGRRFENW